MIVDFKIVPEDSRLWIYQSNKDFTTADPRIKRQNFPLIRNI